MHKPPKICQSRFSWQCAKPPQFHRLQFAIRHPFRKLHISSAHQQGRISRSCNQAQAPKSQSRFAWPCAKQPQFHCLPFAICQYVSHRATARQLCERRAGECEAIPTSVTARLFFPLMPTQPPCNRLAVGPPPILSDSSETCVTTHNKANSMHTAMAQQQAFIPCR